MNNTTQQNPAFKSGFWPQIKALNGWLVILLGQFIVVILASTLSLLFDVHIVFSVFVWFALTAFIGLGLFILEPNNTGVATFFGKAVGSVKGEGLCWINPLYTISKVSTRSTITKAPEQKINDKDGNPLFVAIQGTWHISKNAAANSIFNININVEHYVSNIFNSVLRDVVSKYSYAGSNETQQGMDSIQNSNLKQAGKDIAAALKENAQKLLSIAGVYIDEVEIVSISYAPEIAQTMLQEQQARAFLSARKEIVKGATDVVLQAIDDLESPKNGSKQIVFTEQQKASLVSDLLVVLCSGSQVQPVINLSKTSSS